MNLRISGESSEAARPFTPTNHNSRSSMSTGSGFTEEELLFLQLALTQVIVVTFFKRRMLMNSSSSIKERRDTPSKSLKTTPPLPQNLNKFFINGVTEISSYQNLQRDSTAGEQSPILSHNFTI